MIGLIIRFVDNIKLGQLANTQKSRTREQSNVAQIDKEQHVFQQEEAQCIIHISGKNISSEYIKFEGSRSTKSER